MSSLILSWVTSTPEFIADKLTPRDSPRADRRWTNSRAGDSVPWTTVLPKLGGEAAISQIEPL